MFTVRFGDTEYILRCDLNVIEGIEREFGSFSALLEKSDRDTYVFLLCEMINEHFAFAGDRQRITGEGLRRLITDMDMLNDAAAVALQAVMECVAPKNAWSARRRKDGLWTRGSRKGKKHLSPRAISIWRKEN